MKHDGANPHYRYVLIAIVLLGGFTLFRAAKDVYAPGDADEWALVNDFRSGHALDAQATTVNRLNVLHPSSQPLVSFLSLLSMRLFGKTLVAARLPVVFLSAIFLYLLGVLGLRWLTPPTVILAFAHLAANRTLTWYFHSCRGYVFLIALSVLGICWMNERLTQPAQSHKPVTQMMFLFAGLAMFSHHMALFFFLSLCPVILAWARLNRETLRDWQLSVAGRFSRVYLWQTPLIVALFGLSLFYLAVIGQIRMPVAERTLASTGAGAIHSPALALSVFAAFGVWRLKSKLLITAVVFGIFALSRRQIWSMPRLQFWWLALALNAGGLLLISLFVAPNGVSGRYLLAYPLVLLIAASESVNALGSKTQRRIAYAALILAGVLLPWLESTPWLVTQLAG